MHYQTRILEPVLLEYLASFPVVGLTGPRQSGKSTLIKHLLGKNYQYVSLDEPGILEFFHDDPVKFMAIYNNKIIFDEAQLAPQLFRYIKTAVDQNRDQYGQFVITGSSQFNLLQQISESLAGRIGLLSLLPYQAKEMPKDLVARVPFAGAYPELVGRSYDNSKAWYNSYIKTYLERDVRLLHNIGDLRDFKRLLNLLAANTSQLINMSAFAKDLGVSVNTIKRWISVLEASYIIFLLPPFFKNFGKRIIKSPKIYFYDTGLAAFLTGITTEELYFRGPLYGPLFENYVISEILKFNRHTDNNAELFFLRTNHGDEIDLIVDYKRTQEFFEIKTTSTFNPRFAKIIEKYLSKEQKGFILYQGKKFPYMQNIRIVNIFDYLLEV